MTSLLPAPAAIAPPATPAGHVHVAFDDPSLTWDPTWTCLDDNPNLVTSYSIDRGRQFELDRTDGGRATVEIADSDGILDPTNPDGPYYGLIEPLLQIQLCRHNPVTDTWHTRFRGFVDELDYGFDPSQRVNRLTITCVDIFEIVAAVQLQVTDPATFGNPPPIKEYAGQVFYQTADTMAARVIQVLGDAQIPEGFYVVFSGNVSLYEQTYSPGDSALSAIQEAADAEFPGVANVYPDRYGRLVTHGRQARFDPVTVWGDAGSVAWDFHQWQVGDRAAVDADPTHVAHLREFAFNRGLAKIINHAMATPVFIRDQDIKDQLVKDATSIGKYGIRSWSAQDLLTKESLLDGSTANVETRRFAEYYATNYRQPQNRVTACGFRTMHPTWPGAAITWELLSKIDIADTVAIFVGSPGGGGFNVGIVEGEAPDLFYVEGVHEQVRPLTPDMDDITLTLDLSPEAYFTSDPWEGPHA